jgi:hypothetical protein
MHNKNFIRQTKKQILYLIHKKSSNFATLNFGIASENEKNNDTQKNICMDTSRSIRANASVVGYTRSSPRHTPPRGRVR